MLAAPAFEALASGQHGTSWNSCGPQLMPVVVA